MLVVWLAGVESGGGKGRWVSVRGDEPESRKCLKAPQRAEVGVLRQVLGSVTCTRISRIQQICLQSLDTELKQLTHFPAASKAQGSSRLLREVHILKLDVCRASRPKLDQAIQGCFRPCRSVVSAAAHPGLGSRNRAPGGWVWMDPVSSLY